VILSNCLYSIFKFRTVLHCAPEKPTLFGSKLVVGLIPGGAQNTSRTLALNYKHLGQAEANQTKYTMLHTKAFFIAKSQAILQMLISGTK